MANVAQTPTANLTNVIANLDIWAIHMEVKGALVSYNVPLVLTH